MDYEEPEALVSPSKRKKKQIDEVSVADTTTTAESSTFDTESEADTAATTVDDGLPHPRVCYPVRIYDFHIANLL